jgi:hypothetical protein
MAAKRSVSPPDPAAEGGFADILARLRRVSAHLPGMVEASSYGTPALKVGGKLLVRVKDRDTLVLMSTFAEKEMLLEAAPEVYFETDHYKGWPSLLIRLGRIGDDELRHRLETAWQRQAPKRLVKDWPAERRNTRP